MDTRRNETMTQTQQRTVMTNKISKKSLVALVPFFGLLGVAVQHVWGLIFYYSQQPLFAIYIVIPLIGALAALRGGRIGYIVSTILSLLYFIVEGPFFGGFATTWWASPTVYDIFFFSVVNVPGLFLALVFSIIGLKRVFFPSSLQLRKFPKMIPTSSFLVFIAIGFVLGGLAIGTIAAQTELNLAHNSPAINSSPNIVIVQGAANSNNGQFYSPSSYTVKVGTTVTWENNDASTHTVTSAAGLFDSGPLPPGASFSYTFTKTGTYKYTCTYHPWMTGTIIVTSG